MVEQASLLPSSTLSECGRAETQISDSVMCQAYPLTYWNLKLGVDRPRALFWLVGLDSVVARQSASRCVGCVAILEGVIGQLLHLLSKYLLSAKHPAGCEQTWSLAPWSLQSWGKTHSHANYT